MDGVREACFGMAWIICGAYYASPYAKLNVLSSDELSNFCPVLRKSIQNAAVDIHQEGFVFFALKLKRLTPDCRAPFGFIRSRVLRQNTCSPDLKPSTFQPPLIGDSLY